MILFNYFFFQFTNLKCLKCLTSSFSDLLPQKKVLFYIYDYIINHYLLPNVTVRIDTRMAKLLLIYLLIIDYINKILPQFKISLGLFN